MPVGLEVCHGICETLHFLCVDVLGNNSLDDVIESLKEGKGRQEIEYKCSIYFKGNKAAARDAAFIFVYKMLKGNFGDEQKDSMKVFSAVKYVHSPMRHLITLLGLLSVQLMRRDSTYQGNRSQS